METNKAEKKALIYLNNLESIVAIGEYSRHLANLWLQHRDEFFISFGIWLEKNLSAYEVSLIYNDVKATQKEDEKPQLTKSLIKRAESVKTDEASEENEEENEDEPQQKTEWKKEAPSQPHLQLFTQYENNLKLTPKLLELSDGHFTIGGSIKGSPFIIIGKHEYCNSLQQSLIRGIFKEINFLTREN